jgi:UDP-N-acetylglucosamine/UDP-N-acetylgalactosamine diphosphorylase
MRTEADELRQRLQEHGQEHVLAWWDQLAEAERRELTAQLRMLPLEQLRTLHAQGGKTCELPSADRIEPIPVVSLDADDRAARRCGEGVLRRGEVAALVVAGGQGSRLGFDQPKGMYPIGPVTHKSLFQLHAESMLALGRRHGWPVPLLVMTSPATYVETRAFFAEQRYFGLAPEEVFLFCQGTMPALDRATGRLLLESPGRLCLSPNGHGGALTALAETGLLEMLRQRGIRQVFYFQVDNPLVKVADPVFLGHHVAAGAEASTKIVAKFDPTDKLGNLVQVDGRCAIIEYSDVPEDWARQTDAQGRLRLWAGNTAIHLFAVEFLARVTGEREAAERFLPFHVARKKVPYLDETGCLVQPTTENALKFERFIFDVLPLAERWTVVETSRREEFAPLKNAAGMDSPSAVRQALSNRAADWLEKAGLPVPRQPNGDAAVPLEISPHFALDAEELAAKLDRSLRITGPTYLG